MNSYTYEFIYEMIIWIQCLYEFIYEMIIWIHECMNSCIWIYMYRFWIRIWIHRYMNSYMNSYVWTLNSHIWIHKCEFINMNSFLKLEKNSVFWIRDMEFISEWYGIHKFTNQISVMNSCNELIFLNSFTWIHRRIDDFV